MRSIVHYCYTDWQHEYSDRFGGNSCGWDVLIKSQSATNIFEDNQLFDVDNMKQEYIVALGVNDIKGKDNLKNLYGGKIGSADIDIFAGL